MLRSSSLWVALPSARRQRHQWTCQECCFWHGHPRSLSGPALDPFYCSGEAEETHRAASAIPDTLSFWLLQNCNEIHIYPYQTTLAASAFTEQLPIGADVRFHLQKHPAESPLMLPPLFNWHQTQICQLCHLLVTSPAWASERLGSNKPPEVLGEQERHFKLTGLLLIFSRLHVPFTWWVLFSGLRPLYCSRLIG